ncbi:MAG: NUDIX hydrolase [Bacteroidales bacterium]|nr:MAG: NUDIX hydrolase [Bacteroidales bacterium]
MTEYYSGYDKYLVAVDCIIFGFDGQELKLLLIKRGFPPAEGEWSLMGGFLKSGESINEAAERVLKKLTGLHNVYLEQLRAYGEVLRDPGQRVISIGYYALIKIDEYDEDLVKKYNARWFPIDNFPGLIFDHNEMVDHALKRLQRKAQNQPIGFELLPDKFTIPQLQKLYEEIFRKEFDKRNFRKKILGFQILRKLDEKEKEGSKKGAFLYRFDQKQYTKLLGSGYIFEINV